MIHIVNRLPYLTLLLSLEAKGIEKTGTSGIPPTIYSGVLGGFFVLFLAIFFFTFGVKTIINYKKQKWTSKSILTSSLMIGFIISLVSSIFLYIILSDVQK